MTLTQWFVFLIVAVIVTVPVLLLVPRTRRSPIFDTLLWLATILVAFLVGWLTFVFASQNERLNFLNQFEIAGLPIAIIVVGAAAGALGLNLPMWVADRRAPPVEAEELITEEETEPDQ